MSKRVTLSLTDKQRADLEHRVRSGTTLARTQTKARILLLADRSQGQRLTHKAVAEATLVHPLTVGRTLRRFVDHGLEAALHDKPRPGKTPKITGDIEAHLVTLCCSDPPEGEARWTLRLLAGRVVELGLLDSLSHVAVGERLKKMNLNPGR